MPKSLPAFALCLLTTGCLAPIAKELTVQLDVGPEQVEVRGEFRDLRLTHADELLAFRQVALLDEHAGLELSRLGTVKSWQVLDRGERLDLEFTGSVPRATWDACLGWKPGQPKPPCEGLFPLKREGDELVFVVSDLVNVYEFPPGFSPRARESRKSFTYKLVSKAGRNDGRPAVTAWRLAQGTRGLAQWMNEAERAFTQWDQPDSARRLEAHPADPFADLFLYRKRLALLREALIDSNLDVPAPPEVDLLGRLGQREPLLPKPLPSREARSLERGYRAALGEPDKAPIHFQAGCRGVRSEASKALCRMLGAR